LYSLRKNILKLDKQNLDQMVNKEQIAKTSRGRQLFPLDYQKQKQSLNEMLEEGQDFIKSIVFLY